MDDDGLPPSKAKIGLPAQPWFYTIDQVATLLSTTEAVVGSILWYRGRTTKRRLPGQMIAVNIALQDQMPIWRVPELELIAWCKWRGVVLHRRKY